MEIFSFDELTPFQRLTVWTIRQETGGKVELLFRAKWANPITDSDLLEVINQEWDNLITTCAIEYFFSKYFIQVSIEFIETGKWIMKWKKPKSPLVVVPIEIFWSQEAMENRATFLNLEHELDWQNQGEESVFLQYISPDIVRQLRLYIEGSMNNKKQGFLGARWYITSFLDSAIRQSKVLSISGEIMVAWWDTWTARTFLDYFLTQKILTDNALRKPNKKTR